jgi:hypothetical protein
MVRGSINGEFKGPLIVFEKAWARSHRVYIPPMCCMLYTVLNESLKAVWDL